MNKIKYKNSNYLFYIIKKISDNIWIEFASNSSDSVFGVIQMLLKERKKIKFFSKKHFYDKEMSQIQIFEELDES